MSPPPSHNHSGQIVVTGSGLVSSLGLDRQTTWQRLCNGESGLDQLTALEQRPAEPKDGGQAPELPEGDPHKTCDEPREVRYLRHAIAAALDEAGIAAGDRAPYAPERCGLVFGTTLHGMRAAGAYFRTDDPAPLQHFQAAAVLERAAGTFGFTGLATTTCAACSSGLSSIALAITLLRSGELDMVIAGGYDPISEYAYAGFNSLRLIAAGPPRPFGCDREGMKLGEGYGALVLERADDAERRGAMPIGRVLGFGESADAHHLTQPHPEGRGAIRAIREALEAAALEPGDVDLVTAHATGTPDNERGEYAALKTLFEQRLPEVPIVAFKSWLGHTLGGAGAVECILTLCALNDQRVPPTDHVEADRLEYPELRFARGCAEPARLRCAINLSLGFGGANTCLVLAPPDADASTKDAASSTSVSAPARVRARDASREPVITGIGVVLPEAIGHAGLTGLLDHPSDGGAPGAGVSAKIDEQLIQDLLRTPRTRRMSEYVKLALASAKLACDDAGLDDPTAFSPRDAVLAGTTHGSATYSADYYRQVVEEGIEAANPMLFAEGVPNAGAAHLSLMFGLTGPCQTIIGTRTAGLDALHLAAVRIAEGQWDRAVICAADEAADIVRDAYRHCGLHARDGTGGAPFDDRHGFILGSGAVTLILESRASAESRNARAYAAVERSVTGFHPLGLEAAGTGAGAARCLVEQWRAALGSLGDPTHLITSANSTWVGRAELAAIEAGAAAATVSNTYARVGELFSVGPLVAIAAALLTGKLPALHDTSFPDRASLTPATGDEPADDFAVLSTEYAGLIAAARLRRIS